MYELSLYSVIINREWVHHREISHQGLDVLTERWRGQYNKAEVWDFPVMTEWTRLISYLLYGLFSVFLKKNTIKTPEVIFHTRLRALRLSSSLILKKYLYASFSFSYWKIYGCTLSIFSAVYPHMHIVLIITQKSSWAEKKFHNARSLQENNACSAANQSPHTIVAI